MIWYTLPGMGEHDDLLTLFISLKENAPDMFFDDVVIDSVYGGFPGCALCGGRNNLGAPVDPNKARSMIELYNAHGVGCNATFTNKFVDEHMVLDDEYARGILELLADGQGNGVIFYSYDLAEYIEREFPSLALIASTTMSLETPEETNEALHDFDRAVLDYNYSKDEDFISRVKPASKLEIMVNEYCTLHCPWRDEHYDAVSRAQLEGVPCTFECRHEPSSQAYGFAQGMMDGSVFLHNTDVRRINSRYGVEHFKIVGRGLDRYDVIDALLYYLVQPDCWYEVRDFLVSHHLA